VGGFSERDTYFPLPPLKFRKFAAKELCDIDERERMLANYIPIAMMLGIAVFFGVLVANLSKWIGPRRPTREKLSVYESGMVPIGTTKDRVSIKYYLVAMLFIIFDIEIVFLYPWAVTFDKLGVFALVEMFIFIGLLFVGYIYILKKGALEWD
jgi:NADH-quinone oxidoreductase subunit A